MYGEQALEGQARQNEGQVICPRTKEIYSFKDAEKVYIMWSVNLYRMLVNIIKQAGAELGQSQLPTGILLYCD